MRLFSRLVIPALLLSLATACAENDPAGPGPARSDLALQTTYTYFGANKQPIVLNSRPDLLAIRFRDAVSPDARARFMDRWQLTTAFEDPIFGLVIVHTDEAFTAAPQLWQDMTYVAYVGPVFVPSTCNGAPSFLVPANEVIVRGDLSDPGVLSALRDAGATLVARSEPTRALYQLPWGDPGNLFGLVAQLTSVQSVVYAEPNFMATVCN
jgi:hypothetical protein